MIVQFSAWAVESCRRRFSSSVSVQLSSLDRRRQHTKDSLVNKRETQWTSLFIYIYKYISWSCLFPLDTKMIDIDLLIHNFPRKIFGFSWFFHLQVRWSRACLSSIQQQSQPGAENVDKKHQMFTEKYCRITNHSQ